MVSRAFVPAALGMLVALLFLSPAAPTSAAVCGGAGFDLSSITFADYYYNDTANSLDWWFHPCGNVSQPICNSLYDSASPGIMVCQHKYGDPSSHDIAVWRPGNTQASTTWQAYATGNGMQRVQGVRMNLQDGAGCGGAGATPRTLNVNFQCNQATPPGYLTIVNVTESPQCTYNILAYTRATCGGANSTANALGQTQCGPGTPGSIVLDTITTTDLVYKTSAASNYTYYFRPCGVVQSPQCANNPYGAVAGLSMMCQATGQNNELSPNTYDLAWWNPPLAVWNRAEVVLATGETANAWTMEIADGTSCPADNGINRILKVFFVCDVTATTPIFYNLTETFTCNYQAYVRTVLACNPNQVSTATTPCGGPYDLSFLTQKDLTYNRPGTNEYLVFRACGVVDNAVCQAQPNTNQSMLCQAYQGQTGTNDIAIYNPSAVVYTPTLSGISMSIQDGDVCGANGQRKLTVNFVCAPGAPNQATFVNWVENPVCTYTATILTSSVCHGQRSAYCGPIVGGGPQQQNWDFSLGGTSEYSILSADKQYTYYFQPCGQVLNAQCNANNGTQSSMFCQAQNGGQATYDIAYYDSNLVSWYKLINGWQMFVQDGLSCGSSGYERALTVNFICSTGAPTFVNMSEPTTCNYVAFINTPQACQPNSVGNGAAGSTGLVIPAAGSTGGNPLGYQAITRCGGIYNLLPLSTTDLSWTAGPQSEYNWVFRPCGAIGNSNKNCSAAAASTPGGWMMCQDSKWGYGATEGSSYDQYSVQWEATRNGVLMQQSDGAGCGGLGARVTRAFFVCDQAYTTAALTNVTEGPTCTYTLTVRTNLVCPTTGQTCGGAGYDVSALTTRGDLRFVGNSGYTYYFNPCGVVQNSQCQSDVLSQSAMMCQASQTSNSTYNIAVWAPQAATWTALSNGVSMTIQDGLTCSGSYDFERVLTVNYICGTGFGYSMNVTEVSVCNYVATVQTGLACNQIQTNNGGGGSSGLSGGAIAGIVIGSVVGALIILALLLVVCCGALGGGLRKKSTNADSPKNSGRYGDMDSSTEPSQSNVEMETASGHGGEA